MLTRPHILLLLALTACGDDTVAIPVARIDAPDQVQVDAAIPGQVNAAELPVTNRGTATAWVTVAVSEPAVVQTALLQVPPSTTVSAWVLLQVDQVGPLTVTASLSTESQSLEIPVSFQLLADADGDGVDGVIAGGSDCDDLDPAIFPGAVERCDGVDNDCSGGVDDDAVDAVTWYEDDDGDGWGVEPGETTCGAPLGFVDRPDDCDDDDPEIRPDASEIWYDGIDQDCDGGSDYDADRDGHDFDLHGGDDCLDTVATIHPGADELWYDGLDQDCDGQSDFDRDGDGFDATAEGAGLDCNDDDPSIYPFKSDELDGIDDDCDGLVDETGLGMHDLMITELMLRPAAVLGRFVELSNTIGRDVHLQGFALDSGTGSSILPPLIVAPGESLVLCLDEDSGVNGGVICDGPLPPISTIDSLTITAGDVILDEVDWSAWSLPQGASIELRPAALANKQNDLFAAWCVSSGTLPGGDAGSPGETGSHCP